jgi:phosphate-selective porin OprO/OprP
MLRKSLLIASVSALSIATPAMAQDTEAMQAEMAQMRAQMQAMAQRMNTLEAELAAVEAEAETASTQASNATVMAENAVTAAKDAAAPAQIAFKGTPEIKGEGGWTFKPRGRLQYDAGTVSAPDGAGDDGFGSEARRARLGVSGKMPGGFGYKFEVDFAGNDVAVTDALINYKAGDVTLIAGQMNTFQGLEELTSSLHTSFIERAAFTDAFGFERRVGVAAEVATGDVRLSAGLFSDNMEDLSNRSWSADGRIVVNPKMGDAQLHLGGSIHYADLEAGDTVRYRQRPLVHFTSDRYVNTGRFDASSEFGLGLEAAVIAGPFHAVAEGYWQNVSTPTGIADPTFFGGYAEVGYFLTGGDTRGYKSGKFDRTKPANPVGEGGIGSVQVNLRYDRLDLNDAGILGGTQNGYFASLVWKPTDYTMLLLNYGKLDYTDAALPAATGDTDYNVDVIGVRGQIDF